MIFRPVDGMWMDADGQILADVLREYEMVIDDRCQFARLYDYGRDLCIWYRSDVGRVKITLWSISDK